ncbi:MAG: hypothetical protein HFE97_08765, partial [Oscillospiraceae bacterium]|nr:hypothetical protein [Oscillospiraceae bacterium]
VSFYLYWNTHRDKAIKYIRFYITPYNNVWDVQSCTIRRDKTTASCRDTGPISKTTLSTNWGNQDIEYVILTDWPDSAFRDAQGKVWVAVKEDGSYTNSYGTHKLTAGYLDDVFIRTYWENVWYNNQIKNLVIGKVEIEYMDGTKETLTGNALNACFY